MKQTVICLLLLLSSLQAVVIIPRPDISDDSLVQIKNTRGRKKYYYCIDMKHSKILYQSQVKE